jgi:hypothetical protein
MSNNRDYRDVVIITDTKEITIALGVLIEMHFITNFAKQEGSFCLFCCFSEGCRGL